MMKRKIAIVGAFDRYNYGDLLFPIVVEEFLKKEYKDIINNNYDLQYYALIESDLSYCGGKKTKSIRELEFVGENNIFVVSGGEIISAKLSGLYEDISKNKFTNYMKKVTKKLIGEKKYSIIARRGLGIKTEHPFVVEPDDYQNKAHVVYNTVGGSHLSTGSDNQTKFVVEKLKNSDYVSVRDRKTQEILGLDNVNLCPDSAIIMSEFFDVQFLKKNVRKELIDYCNNKNYIVFQSRLSTVKKNLNDIVKQLEMIYKDGFDIMLMPIGIAQNHNDDEALKLIAKNLNIPYEFPQDLNIYEIMYIESQSKCFIGTSLHGNITAISYSVNNIGIDKGVKKLDEFLKTWSLHKNNNDVVDVNHFYDRFKLVQSITPQSRIENSRRLINLVYNNFRKMFDNYII